MTHPQAHSTPSPVPHFSDLVPPVLQAVAGAAQLSGAPLPAR